MSSVPQANYLLIDGVLRANALANLYALAEPVEIEPLYQGTRWRELKDLGPILVATQGSSDLIQTTWQSAAQQADASLLYSPAPIIAVADHLRRFIAPSDVRGSKGLLRFADPLVARHWLGSYQGAHRDAVLGPIQSWHLPQRSHSWALDQPPSGAHSLARRRPLSGWRDTLSWAKHRYMRLIRPHAGASWNGCTIALSAVILNTWHALIRASYPSGLMTVSMRARPGDFAANAA